jgi:hypothetical protein
VRKTRSGGFALLARQRFPWQSDQGEQTAFAGFRQDASVTLQIEHPVRSSRSLSAPLSTAAFEIVFPYPHCPTAVSCALMAVIHLFFSQRADSGLCAGRSHQRAGNSGPLDRTTRTSSAQFPASWHHSLTSQCLLAAKYCYPVTYVPEGRRLHQYSPALCWRYSLFLWKLR